MGGRRRICCVLAGSITQPAPGAPADHLLSLDTADKEDQPRLLRILVDPESPFDGEATKELRRVMTPEGLRFFELRVPIALTRDAARLTTDNVFDLLAGFRSNDYETTSYTREFPFEATADYYDFLDLILRSELGQTEIERLRARSRNYLQFMRFLTAIEKAEAQYGVLIEVMIGQMDGDKRLRSESALPFDNRLVFIASIV